MEDEEERVKKYIVNTSRAHQGAQRGGSHAKVNTKKADYPELPFGPAFTNEEVGSSLHTLGRVNSVRSVCWEAVEDARRSQRNSGQGPPKTGVTDHRIRQRFRYSPFLIHFLLDRKRLFVGRL